MIKRAPMSLAVAACIASSVETGHVPMVAPESVLTRIQNEDLKRRRGGKRRTRRVR